EPGTGNVVEAVRHLRQMNQEIAALETMTPEQLGVYAEKERVPLERVREVQVLKRLPVINFAAGGIATPADASLCRLLGADGIFVGSGIFKSANPRETARAIVEASMHHTDWTRLSRVSSGLGEAMKGLEISTLAPDQLLQVRE
ncbi:pyridoxal biosynthesis lyase PdxS, partial [mine drainage metagenome]